MLHRRHLSHRVKAGGCFLAFCFLGLVTCFPLRIELRCWGSDQFEQGRSVLAKLLDIAGFVVWLSALPATKDDALPLVGQGSLGHLR